MTSFDIREAVAKRCGLLLSLDTGVTFIDGNYFCLAVIMIGVTVSWLLIYFEQCGNKYV